MTAAVSSHRRWPLIVRCGLTALCCGLTGSVAAEASNPIKTSEPYEMAGKRLVFTNWYFIRPGTFAWRDAAGNNVSVRGDQGPWGASFDRHDMPYGIRLAVQPAERIAVTIESDPSWGAKGAAITTLIKEGDNYRAWATCSGDAGSGWCRLDSTDGMTFRRSDRNENEVDGQKANPLNVGEGTIFLDPSAPPEDRYKLVTLSHMTYEAFEAYKKQRPDGWEPRARREDVGQVFFVQGAVSPDGIHWRTLPEPLVVEHSDTQIVPYYDARLRKYVIYTRNWMVGAQSPRAKEGWGACWYCVGRRSIGRTESDEFRRFPLSELILVPPNDWPPTDVLYTNCRTSIPGAPDHHLMFPTVWHTRDDTTSVVMAASHDGKVWNYVPGGTVFKTPPFGEWDGGCVFARPNLVELPDGSFVLPYTGYSFPHKYPRGQLTFGTGYMRWPKGRVVALESPELGEFATVAIMPPGHKLLINALTQRAGRILVEVAGLDGTPLPGRSFAEADPIQGDQYRKPVAWKGNSELGFSDGQPIILRFKMDRAKVFALEFE